MTGIVFFKTTPGLLTVQSNPSAGLQPVIPGGFVQHTATARLTGVRVCATLAFRVSVSVGLSIMQPLTLTPELLLSLLLNMHSFPSPESVPSQFPQALCAPPSAACSMLIVREHGSSAFDVESNQPLVVLTCLM